SCLVTASRGRMRDERLIPAVASGAANERFSDLMHPAGRFVAPAVVLAVFLGDDHPRPLLGEGFFPLQEGALGGRRVELGQQSKQIAPRERDRNRWPSVFGSSYQELHGSNVGHDRDRKSVRSAKRSFRRGPA